ncbi:phage polarity suppression protein [Klebsiella pneumoniae]|uniref:phage polarity suppression protein n=1 Tax=Klebsiella pneumoniae TaxID=573 RepID=UPI000A39AA89|nr:phage polarity suppression protein [Klebsiella pneumoniae]OUK68526.1 hypothetical protein BZY49_08485 [Klebsiella pneumoniae]
MTTLTLQQAFEACQKNETAWLNRKAELAAAEQEYQEQVLAGDDRIPGRMQTRVDNQEKYTPAQSLIYARRRTELAGR